jgi:hypothetical protein
VEIAGDLEALVRTLFGHGVGELPEDRRVLLKFDMGLF